ncbi:hypothetical protein ANTQUA_LOCUS6292 [Anthophora quadrimaculata]
MRLVAWSLRAYMIRARAVSDPSKYTGSKVDRHFEVTVLSTRALNKYVPASRTTFLRYPHQCPSVCTGWWIVIG